MALCLVVPRSTSPCLVKSQLLLPSKANSFLNDRSGLPSSCCLQCDHHPINKFKNLGYDRWLQYKQPRQELGLCWFSVARYSQRCIAQIYRALYGDAMFVPFGGTQTWRPETNRNICHWFLLQKRKFLSRGTQKQYSTTFSNARTVQISKFLKLSFGISHFLTSSAVM